MRLGVYSIKDDVAGDYKHFGFFNNDALAKRAFDMGCKEDGIPVNDLSLYLSGYFDTDTGRVICDELENLGTMPVSVSK